MEGGIIQLLPAIEVRIIDGFAMVICFFAIPRSTLIFPIIVCGKARVPDVSVSTTPVVSIIIILRP